MNCGAPSSQSNTKALPPILAAALLVFCAWTFMKPPQDAARHTDPLSAPSPADLPPTPAGSLAAANQLPGVLSLPPASLAGSAMFSLSAPHQPPPPASWNAFSLADLKAQMPQRADGTFLTEIPTLYFSAGDPAARQVMDGQPVETTAQARHDPTNPALLELTRSLTRCCSADSRAYSVAVELGPSMTSFPDGTWVTVAGTIRYRREIGGYGPVVHAAAIQQIPAPANPILK